MEAAAGSDAAFGFMSLSILALKKFRVAELLELCNFSMTITGRIIFPSFPPISVFLFTKAAFSKTPPSRGHSVFKKGQKKSSFLVEYVFFVFLDGIVTDLFVLVPTMSLKRALTQ